MTNKEYIIKVLSDVDNDPFDDGGASYEALVDHNIKCPYNCTWDKRAHCYNGSGDGCVACKMEWLESEVDE